MSYLPLCLHPDRDGIIHGIYKQLPGIRHQLKAKGIPMHSLDKWVEYMQAAYNAEPLDGQTVVLPGYLMMYSIAESWYAPGRFLNEHFLVAYEHGVNPTKHIEDFARHTGCTHILISTAAQASGAYPRLLRRAGYSPVYETFMKEIQYG